MRSAAFAAKWRDHSPEERAAWATQRIAERLDLDDAQKDALKKVTDRYVEMRGAQPEFMTMLSSQLKELSQDDSLTVDEVNQLRDQIKAEFDRRADAIIPDFVSFYNTLNDEQRDMVTARLERMSEHMEHRGGGHWGGGHWGEHWGGKHHHRDSDD